MAKPDYLIIGVQKGGTSSAIYHFNQHPDIFLAEREMHFFETDKYFKNGIRHYEKQFVTNKKFVGEKTPAYVYLQYCIDRIYKYNPLIKLIVFLREPVSRAYSQFNMEVKINNLKKSFKESICEIEKVSLAEIRENGYWALQRGFYIEQIEYILSKFDRRNLYIAISEQVKEYPLEEYNRIFEFIGARKLQPSEFRFRDDVHQLEYRSGIADEDFNYLCKLYKPYNERLYNFLGYRIDKWETVYRSRCIE